MAKAYYEKNGMLPQGGQPDHKNPALARYKNDLKLRAAKAVGNDPAAPQPTAQPQMGGAMSNFGLNNNMVLKLDTTAKKDD